MNATTGTPRIARARQMTADFALTAGVLFLMFTAYAGPGPAALAVASVVLCGSLAGVCVWGYLDARRVAIREDDTFAWCMSVLSGVMALSLAFGGLACVWAALVDA